MAHPFDKRGRVCKPGVVRLVLLLVGFFLICYIVRPPSPSLNRGNKSNNVLLDCPPCSCDCSFESDIFSMPFDALNSSFADCGKDDPEVSEEMKKDNIALLSEEISLQNNVTRDSLERTRVLIMDAKRTSSHYQREAEKCNVAMETCEAARERAEAELTEERKLSVLWETRARENGWNDDQ